MTIWKMNRASTGCFPVFFYKCSDSIWVPKPQVTITTRSGTVALGMLGRDILARELTCLSKDTRNEKTKICFFIGCTVRWVRVSAPPPHQEHGNEL